MKRSAGSRRRGLPTSSPSGAGKEARRSAASTAFRTSGRRAGQRFDAEHGVTTEALVFLSSLEPELIGPNLDFATHYEPTPVRDVERLLDAIPPPLEQTTFVDVGSGMGRVVLMAACRPFKLVAGVEISPTLHEVARENLARFDAELLHCRDIRLIRADAADYRFPRGTLAVYLYNPFRAPVLERVLDHILAQRRDVTLLYHTPLERERIEARAGFELVGEFGDAAVYRRIG
jgi:SAM-dependent methyltransferase